MENGAYPADFWELTPAEIHDITVSRAKQQEQDMRSRAVFAWHSAYLTGVAFNSPREFPRRPEEYFTFLRDAVPAWKRSQQSMARIAAAHNKHRGEVGS